MNQESNHTQNIFGGDVEQANSLWYYMQSLSPEAIAKLSKPESPEVFQVMEKNIVGLLGSLPSEDFDVSISTSRKHLGKLLASAMMSGYFLRNAEQRLNFEQSLSALNES